MGKTLCYAYAQTVCKAAALGTEAKKNAILASVCCSLAQPKIDGPSTTQTNMLAENRKTELLASSVSMGRCSNRVSVLTAALSSGRLMVDAVNLQLWILQKHWATMRSVSPSYWLMMLTAVPFSFGPRQEPFAFFLRMHWQDSAKSLY